MRHSRLRSIAAAVVCGLVLTTALVSSVVASGQEDPPPNDDLANAQPVFGFPATVRGTLSGATAEDGSPYPFEGVWYRFTAPRAVALRVALQGRADVALFEGSPPYLSEIPLTARRVRYNLDYWETTQTLTAGTEYFIAIGDGFPRFKFTIDGFILGTKVLARQAPNPFNLRIPIKLEADAGTSVRVTGELYVRPHQKALSERRRLATQSVEVGPGGSSSVRMRLPAKNSERGCKALLYALSLKDVRVGHASGTVMFSTASGDREAVPWEVILDRLDAGDRPKIRQGAGVC